MSSVFYDFLDCILHNKKSFISVIWLFSYFFILFLFLFEFPGNIFK